ncbi:MAG: RloB domain-containing protein [Candidatus Hydrogenedentota bacterium]
MSRKASRGRRRRCPRRYSPRILVVGEGKQTEYNYLATFAAHFKRANGPALVPRQPRQTGSPVTIVREAIQIAKNDVYFDSKQGDRCYCLLDVEPHDPTKATCSLKRWTSRSEKVFASFYPTLPLSFGSCAT